MSYHTHTACHLLQPVTLDHRTPEGEDSYYRHHGWTMPNPLAVVRARLADLHRFTGRAGHTHTAVPALK